MSSIELKVPEKDCGKVGSYSVSFDVAVSCSDPNADLEKRSKAIKEQIEKDPSILFESITFGDSKTNVMRRKQKIDKCKGCKCVVRLNSKSVNAHIRVLLENVWEFVCADCIEFCDDEPQPKRKGLKEL